MEKITIAFDCDGTLIRNGAADNHKIIANERIRTMLVTLASFKNVEIWVWSGGGELWARQVGAAIGIDKYVKHYKSKNLIGEDSQGHPIFAPEEFPDGAIDDIQSCTLGKLFNLIVNEL